MLNIKERKQIMIGELEIGDTFYYRNSYFVVIDEMSNVNSIEGMTMCFNLEFNNIVACDKESYVELKEIDCYIRDYS